jgi:tRNA (guanine-N7-)-methyltransferase
MFDWQHDFPQSIPAQGWLSPCKQFFFRPKMRETEASWQPLDLCWPQKEIAVEFCSGNGHWVVAQAKVYPQYYWVAVEKRLSRAGKILRKAQIAGLENLLVVCSEAKWFTHHYLQNNQIVRVFVNFPDPWPKDKHSHHRLFEPQFVEELTRVCASGAQFHLVTDHAEYLEQALECMKAHPLWSPTLEAPYWVNFDLPHWGYSYFGELWTSKGCHLYRTQLLRS